MDVTGEAYWSADRREGSCRVLNLSVGGAAIADPTPQLAIGTVLSFTIKVNGTLIDTIRAEVVRTETDQLALRFMKLSDAQQTAIQTILSRGQHPS